MQALHLCLLCSSIKRSLLVVFLCSDSSSQSLLDRSSSGIGSHRVVGSHSGAVGIATHSGTLGVQANQRRHYLLTVVGLPELQVGTTLQQLTHALGLFDTRHFHHDTTVASFQLLDIGLHHAKLVNTVAHHIERVVNGALHLCTQCALYLCIGALCAHLALHLLGGKHLCQAMARCILLIILDKERNEVRLTGLFLFLCLLHGFGEGCIFLVVGKYSHHIGHRHLKDNVHTALQVESKSDLHLTALLVGVHAKEIHFLVHNRVDVFPSCLFAHGSRLVIVVTGHEGERQVEHAYQHKRPCD